MRESDVLVQHVYYVDFDPVKACEFDGKHLAVVLKKNKDKKTALVVPLTRSSNGDGDNKTNIGKISSLPTNLRGNDSYLVFNQVRTVNFNRFIALRQGPNAINCSIDDGLFNEILALCSNEISSIMPIEDRMDYHYTMYVKSVVEQIVNTAYTIKKLIQKSALETEMAERKPIETEVIYHSTKIADLLKNGISYSLEQVDRNNGIDTIISKCLSNTIIDELQTQKATG